MCSCVFLWRSLRYFPWWEWIVGFDQLIERDDNSSGMKTKVIQAYNAWFVPPSIMTGDVGGFYQSATRSRMFYNQRTPMFNNVGFIEDQN